MSNTPKIKMCGMMKEVDIDYVNELLPDYVGFVFANTRRKISLEQAKKFRAKLNPSIPAVGVFVDESISNIRQLVVEGAIDMVQLHGSEDEEYITTLKSVIAPRQIPLIKAIKVTCAEDILACKDLPVDYLLLDTYRAGVLGGTGETFSWMVIDEVRDEGTSTIFGKPFFLAGGLTAENLPKAMAYNAYGYDLSSGIEESGSKNYEKMKFVMETLRKNIAK